MWIKVVESQASAPTHLLHLASLASGVLWVEAPSAPMASSRSEEDGADVLEVCWLENEAAWASANRCVSMFYTHVQPDQNQQ